MVATYTETHPPVLGRPGNLHNGEHFCAETSGSNYLTKIGGAAPSDVRYTEAVRPRYVRNIANGKPTKDPYVRMCVNCQDLYDEDMFPPKVPRDEGGRWSMQNGN